MDDRGRIITDAALRSVSHPDVYAIGDAAAGNVAAALARICGPTPSGGGGRAAKGTKDRAVRITAAEVSQSPISGLASEGEHHDNVIIGQRALKYNQGHCYSRILAHIVRLLFIS